MSGSPADGVARVRMEYAAFGRPASMTWYARTFDRSAPDELTLRALCDNLGLWEDNGFHVGYALLRSVDSHYVNTRAWSLDPRSASQFASGPFDRSGVVPGFVSPMIPAALSPMVYWELEPGAQRFRGRSYCPGLSEQFTRFTGDTMVINDLYGDALVTQMEEVRSFMALAGCDQVCCSLARSVPGQPVLGSWRVQAATNGDRKMGTQRRRVRHGRG